jgi:hypothetical protein
MVQLNRKEDETRKEAPLQTDSAQHSDAWFQDRKDDRDQLIRTSGPQLSQELTEFILVKLLDLQKRSAASAPLDFVGTIAETSTAAWSAQTECATVSEAGRKA